MRHACSPSTDRAAARPSSGAARAAGFTLIELMITVAIVALLASIAYPAYTSAVTKGKRAEGRTALTELMQQQERYLTQTNSYLVVAKGATNAPFKMFSGDDASKAAYQLGAELCPGTPAPSIRECVLVRAYPNFTDPEVRELTSTSSGIKGCTGSKPSICWK